MPVKVELNGHMVPIDIDAILGEDYGIQSMLYPEEEDMLKTAEGKKVGTRMQRLVRHSGVPYIVSKLCGL